MSVVKPNLFALSGILLISSCGNDTGSQSNDSDSVDSPAGTTACSSLANLEIIPLDIWGADLESVELVLDRQPQYVYDPDAGPGVVMFPLGTDPVSLLAILDAPDFFQASVTLTWDGTSGPGGFVVQGPEGGARVVSGWQIRTVASNSCPIYSVYLGLDHEWFAPSGSAPSYNKVELLHNGEAAWEAVAADLDEASSRVSISTWWWESDFELIRPDDHMSMSSAERDENTIMTMLEGLSGVERRILINRFWDENSDWSEYLNTDTQLAARAQAAGDAFEVMLQGNPTEVPVTGQWEGEAADFDFAQRVLDNPRYHGRSLLDDDSGSPMAVDLEVQAASYHQKFLTIDGQVAYVAGMNIKGTDWDGDDHLVFDERRMEFDATYAERQEVANKEELPDYGPRKDYAVRIEGPAVYDVEQIFQERWDLAIDEGDLYSENATPFSLDPVPDEIPASQGGVLAQLGVTLPEPWNQQSIRESHEKAFSQATRYILIEDQYFRAPIMNQVILERMAQEPDLVLIVAIPDVSTWDGGAKFTYLSDATFRELFPERYLLLQLRVMDVVAEEGWIWDDVYVYVQDMDLHSKLRLVDDRYLSVGSCNFNNRGYLFEGEMDISVLDESTATAAREWILADFVGDDWKGLLSDDPVNNMDVLRVAAESNQEILDWWEDHGSDLDADEAESTWASYHPSGFVYPLQISADYEWDVGPDLF